MKTVYYVYYGDNLSYTTFPSWNEAARFVKYLLDNKTRVKAITKALE